MPQIHPSLTLAAAVLAVLAAAPAPAQEAAAPPEAGERQLGEPYLVAEHQDWAVICTQFEADGPEVCDMYQMLFAPDGSPIAEISIAAFPPDGEIAAGATITTPLETFLPTGLGFRIEGGIPRFEGFRVCTQVGCIVRMALSPDEITMMRGAATATATIAPFVQVETPVEIPISLGGFSAAFDDLLSRPTFAQ